MIDHLTFRTKHPSGYLRNRGVSLPELLLALLILANIATFAIPKVLSSQQNSVQNAKAKEIAAAISNAYQMHLLSGGDIATTNANQVMQHINYVRVWGLGNPYTVDNPWAGCNNTNKCYLLTNGAFISHPGGVYTMGGTDTTNGINFSIDIDSQTSSPSHKLTFTLYSTGRLVSAADREPNTCHAQGCFGPGTDPVWFSWD